MLPTLVSRRGRKLNHKTTNELYSEFILIPQNPLQTRVHLLTNYGQANPRLEFTLITPPHSTKHKSKTNKLIYHQIIRHITQQLLLFRRQYQIGEMHSSNSQNTPLMGLQPKPSSTTKIYLKIFSLHIGERGKQIAKLTTVDIHTHNVWGHQSPIYINSTTVDTITYNVWGHQPPVISKTNMANNRSSKKFKISREQSVRDYHRSHDATGYPLGFSAHSLTLGSSAVDSPFFPYGKGHQSPGSGTSFGGSATRLTPRKTPPSRGVSQLGIQPVSPSINTIQGISIPAINQKAISAWLASTSSTLNKCRIQYDAGNSIKTFNEILPQLELSVPIIATTHWIKFQRDIGPRLTESEFLISLIPFMERNVDLAAKSLSMIAMHLSDVRKDMDRIAGKIETLWSLMNPAEKRAEDTAMVDTNVEEEEEEEDASRDPELLKKKHAFCTKQMQLHVKVHNDLDHLRGSLEDHWIQDGRGTLQTIRQRVANEKPATPGSETQRSHERGSPGARSVHHSRSPASISGSFRGKGQWKPEAVVEKDPLMWTLATVPSITEYQENPKGRHFIQTLPRSWHQKRYPGHIIEVMLANEQDQWPTELVDVWPTEPPKPEDAYDLALGAMPKLQDYEEYLKTDPNKVYYSEDYAAENYRHPEEVPMSTTNWRLSGWHGLLHADTVQQEIGKWPGIVIPGDHILIMKKGNDIGGTIIQIAQFAVEGMPIALWNLAKSRAFLMQGVWVQLDIMPHHRGDHLTNGHMVYTGIISKFARQTYQAIDFPMGAEDRLLKGYTPIECIISLPGLRDSWGIAINYAGTFQIAFRDPASRDAYFQLGARVPLTLTDIPNIGKIDALTREVEQKLGTYRVKWMWFEKTSGIHMIRQYMTETFGPAAFQGIRREKPNKACIYTIGFNSLSDLTTFTKKVHGRPAPERLHPLPSRIQRVVIVHDAPRGACYNCYHPDFAAKAKSHRADSCPNNHACRVCRHHEHTEQQCGYTRRTQRVLHRAVDDFIPVEPLVQYMRDDASQHSEMTASSWASQRVGQQTRRRRTRVPGSVPLKEGQEDESKQATG